MRRKKIVLIKTKECIVTHGKHAFFVRNCCVLLREEKKKLWNSIIFLPAASRTNKDIMFLLANILANKDTTVKDTTDKAIIIFIINVKIKILPFSVILIEHLCIDPHWFKKNPLS